jgi:crotonobetaine/carnitine-CoA ligase
MVRVTETPLDRPWSGVALTSIVDVLHQACVEDPTAPAFIFEDGLVVSRGDLQTRVEAFAGYLSTRLRPGDRMAVMLGNRAEWMVAWFAAVGCRATVVSMNPAAQEHDAGHVLRDSGARLILTDFEHADLFERLRESCAELDDVLVLTGAEPDGLARYVGKPVPLADLVGQSATEDIANVYYTSGTTGVPKGCMVDHVYWLRFVDLFQRVYGMDSSDRLICCLQFFYNDPPWHTLLSLTARTPLVVMRKFSVSRFWNVVRDNDVTIVFGIASTASLLLKAPPDELDRAHKVRYVVHVGIPADLHSQLVERWGVPWVEGYGLTETGLVVSMPLDRAAEMTGSGSIGLPCPEVEVRLADDDDHDVPDGSVGEILLRAPGLMTGYLNRPEATAEAMRGGWLHTGDLGHVDGDGYLYFRGRKKDIVRRGGENIAAVEVEQVLRSHPEVLEAAVIPAADAIRGEEVHAVIVLVQGRAVTDATAPDLVAFAAERLAKYKVPRYLTFRDEDFPRTPSMRVKKDEIRDTVPGWDRESELGW